MNRIVKTVALTTALMFAGAISPIPAHAGSLSDVFERLFAGFDEEAAEDALEPVEEIVEELAEEMADDANGPAPRPQIECGWERTGRWSWSYECHEVYP